MPLGINIPGVTWNSWYNPLDNVANVVSGTAENIGQVVAGNDAPTVEYSNQNTQQYLDNSTEDSSLSSSGGTTSGGGSGYSAEDLAFLDSQIAQLQGRYGAIDTAYDQGLKGVENSYNKNVSDTNFSRTRSLEDLQLKDTANEDAYKGANERNQRYASTLADSVRRKIGMASGQNSSAYLYDAPGAVAKDANEKQAGIVEDYGQNFANLQLTKKRANEDYQKLLDSLAEQRQQKQYGLETGIQEQRQGIDQQLAGLAAERAKLLGGGYGETRIAQQPYIDQYNQRQQAITSLFDKYNPTFQKQEVKVDTPTLKDYVVNRTGINGQRVPTYEPYTNYLKKDEEQNV